MGNKSMNERPRLSRGYCPSCTLLSRTLHHVDLVSYNHTAELLDTVVRHDPHTAAVCTFVSHLSDARAGRWGAGLNVGRDNPRCIAGVVVQRYRCRAIFWRHYARRDATAGLQVQGGAVGEGLGAEPLDEPS